MGIGAFESREYIRHIGGDIRVRNKPGQGSVFHVSLPAAGRQQNCRLRPTVSKYTQDKPFTNGIIMSKSIVKHLLVCRR